MTLSLTLAIIGLATTFAVAMREHAKVMASRRTLLDRCAALLSNAAIKHGGDGFPVLEGFRGNHFIRVELVSDTMTIRRLPQLWLKLTRVEVRPNLPEFSVLVRPSGTEFYSLTNEHSRVLEPPPALAPETIVRGDRPASQQMLNAVAPALRRMFAGPGMKEVAVTGRGLRLIWQAAEGQRGEHLLRQCRFENAGVSTEVLAARLADLDDLSVAINEAREARAA
ncbi:MAG TPA: hypothetical protein VIF39_03315 [Hyphomicrobium sp.]